MPNKAKERKGKKQRKVHPKKLKSTQYKIDGEKVQRKRFCPKCGPGVFLADHKDRFSCGNCSYTEFKQK